MDMLAAASSASTRSRSGAGTSSRATRSRTRPRPAPSTTRATTRARSTSLLRSAGYDELRAEQQRRRDRGGHDAARNRHLAATSRSRTVSARPSSARSRSRRTAARSSRTGSFSHGQGHETTFAMIVAERLGLPIEKVTSTRATPTRSPRAPAPTVRSRRRSAVRPPGSLRSEVWSGEAARRRLPRGERATSCSIAGSAPARAGTLDERWRGPTSPRGAPQTAGSRS